MRTCSYLPSCLLRNVFCVQWKCQGQQHLLTLVSHCPSQIECLSSCDVLCVLSHLLSHLLPVTANLTELQLPLGIFEKSWTVRLVQNCVSLLGMETGRHFLWDGEPASDSQGAIFEAVLLVLYVLQIVFVMLHCDDTVAAEIDDGLLDIQWSPGGYECLYRSKVP